MMIRASTTHLVIFYVHRSCLSGRSLLYVHARRRRERGWRLLRSQLFPCCLSIIVNHDAKLLLLTVPACAMLWAEGGTIGWLALVLNAAGFVLTGDLPWALFLGFIGKLHLPTTGLSGQVLTIMQILPVPLILLIVGIFYLWVYVRRLLYVTRWREDRGP